LGNHYDIITNIIPDRNVKVDYYKFPIMLRLTNSKSLIFNNSERLIGYRMLYWWLEGDSQKYEEIKMEKCDINKHFGEYSSLFDSSDIETFYCLLPRSNNYTLNGLYGDKNSFSYYNFYLHFCTNSSTKNDCFDLNTIKNTLQNPFLEVRSIEYVLNNFNKFPGSLVVRSDRHAISSSVYKRIWMYIRSFNYTTDEGYILSSINLQNFFMVDSFRYDVDLRDFMTGSSIPYTFCTFTLLNYSHVNYTYRELMKLQNLIAQSGGIIKGIMSIFFVLNYLTAQHLLEEKLANSTCSLFSDNEKDQRIEVNSERTINNYPAFKPYKTEVKLATIEGNPNFNLYERKCDLETLKRVNSCNFNELDVISEKSYSKRTKTPDNLVLLEMALTLEKIRKAQRKKNKMTKLKFYQYLLPFCCFSNSKSIKNLKKRMEIVYDKMNVIYMIKKFHEIEIISDLLFTHEQKILFSLIPWNLNQFRKDPSFSDINKSYNYILMNQDNNVINKNILKMISKISL